MDCTPPQGVAAVAARKRAEHRLGEAADVAAPHGVLVLRGLEERPDGVHHGRPAAQQRPVRVRGQRRRGVPRHLLWGGGAVRS